MPVEVVLNTKGKRFELKLDKPTLSGLLEVIESKSDVKKIVGPKPVFEVFNKDSNRKVRLDKLSKLKNRAEVFLITQIGTPQPATAVAEAEQSQIVLPQAGTSDTEIKHTNYIAGNIYYLNASGDGKATGNKQKIINQYPDPAQSAADAESKRVENEALITFIELQERLKVRYKTDLNWQTPISFIPKLRLHMKTFYVQLEFLELGEKKKNPKIELSYLYDRVVNERRVLIMGDGGYGKTTLTQKMAFDWAEGEKQLEKIDAVVLYQLRKLIDNQNSFEESLLQHFQSYFNPKAEVSTVKTMIKNHGAKILIVLDGLDEITQDKRNKVTVAIKTSIFAPLKILVTSRTTENHLKLFQSKFKIKGLIREEGEKLVCNYFNLDSLKHFTGYQVGTPLRNITEFLHPDDIFDQGISAFLLFLVCFSCVDVPTPLTTTFQILANVFSVLGQRCNERQNLGFTISQREEIFLKLGEFAYFQGPGAEYDEKNLRKKLGEGAELVLNCGVMTKLNTSKTVYSKVAFQFSHKLLFDFVTLSFMNDHCKKGIPSEKEFLTELQDVWSVYEKDPSPTYSVLLFREYTIGCIALVWKKEEGDGKDTTMEVRVYMGKENKNLRKRIMREEETSRFIKFTQKDLSLYYNQFNFSFIQSQLDAINSIKAVNNSFYFRLFKPLPKLKPGFVFIRYTKIEKISEENEPFVSTQSLSLQSSIRTLRDHFAPLLFSPLAREITLRQDKLRNIKRIIPLIGFAWVIWFQLAWQGEPTFFNLIMPLLVLAWILISVIVLEWLIMFLLPRKGQLKLSTLLMPIQIPEEDLSILRYLFKDIFVLPSESSEAGRANSGGALGLVCWVVRRCAAMKVKWNIKVHEYDDTGDQNHGKAILTIFVRQEGIELLTPLEEKWQKKEIGRAKLSSLDDEKDFDQFRKWNEKFVIEIHKVA